MNKKLNVWPYLGPIKLNEKAEDTIQEILLYGYFYKGINQNDIIESRIQCSCTVSNLHGMGDVCNSCKSRRELNRVVEQFLHHKNLNSVGTTK